jgi:SAM-dependent methyltransferase
MWVKKIAKSFLLNAGFYKYVAKPGRINFGDLNRVTPFSTQFGYDRGGPVDRYYIENFLEKNKADISGDVLEIGDNEYTLRFGGSGVSKSHVLHVDEKNPVATYVGDLSNAPDLPDNKFDCIVLTQTLHLIYHYKNAIETCYRILKPGGVLLLTVPGISNIDHNEWGDSWLWSFTGTVIKKILEEVFPYMEMYLLQLLFCMGWVCLKLKRENWTFAIPIINS